MPRPCAVESHARGYNESHSTLSQMPRPCTVESHAHGYNESHSTLSQMPRPCAVESHARGYNESCPTLSQIGVGRDDWIRSPSLRTGQADLPHPALQLVVHLEED